MTKTAKATSHVISASDQMRLAALSPLVSSEGAVRVQLTTLTAELDEIRSAAAPLEQRRDELEATLKRIDAAKAEAVKIKAGK